MATRARGSALICGRLTPLRSITMPFESQDRRGCWRHSRTGKRCGPDHALIISDVIPPVSG